MKIENYREQPSESLYTTAVFDLYLPKIGLTMRNLKLNKDKKGYHYISFPSFVSSTDMTTQRKIYTPYFSFSEDRQKLFVDEIFDNLTPFVKGGIMRYSR